MYFTCIKLTMFQKKCLWIKITISIKINQSIHQLRLHSNLLTIISDSPKQEGNYRGRPSTEVIQQPLAFDSSTSFQLLPNICKSEFVMLILYTLQTAILFSFFFFLSWITCTSLKIYTGSGILYIFHHISLQQ